MRSEDMVRAFDKRAAAETIEALALDPSNRAIAGRWLSLWPGDALPPRSAFHPAMLTPYLPNILMFNVVPQVSVTVRLAGTRYNHILGTELTGRDWIAAAPEHHRAVRLGLFSAIARGAVVMDHRRLAMSVGDAIVVEEILLPFAAEAGGVHPVLVHVNLKADQYLKISSVKEALSDPLDYKLVELKVLEPAA